MTFGVNFRFPKTYMVIKANKRSPSNDKLRQMPLQSDSESQYNAYFTSYLT